MSQTQFAEALLDPAHPMPTGLVGPDGLPVKQLHDADISPGFVHRARACVIRAQQFGHERISGVGIHGRGGQLARLN
jgi:hypothetical protein